LRIRIMVVTARTVVFIGVVAATTTRWALLVLRAVVKMITPTLRVREQEFFLFNTSFESWQCSWISFLGLVDSSWLYRNWIFIHCGLKLIFLDECLLHHLNIISCSTTSINYTHSVAKGYFTYFKTVAAIRPMIFTMRILVMWMLKDPNKVTHKIGFQ
jgi:hypothetical protein